MIVGVGIDVVEIARLASGLARTQRLATRLFTERERDLPLRSLAARFAAKEALAKALGAPPGLVWTDAEIITGADGRPELRVYGTVAAAARPEDRKSTRLNSSHSDRSRMPSSA